MLAVWASFFVSSAVSAPVPAVNEPHYLCKARHYWQPDWCAKDFFLQSKNAHTVFYVTIGSMTQWLSLSQTALIGRLLATLVLAAGWISLLSKLGSCRWFPLSICWAFLFLASCGNFSGEWLVGGLEGKVFSYGLLFGAWGQLQRNRLVFAAALAGLGIAFHPVIGLWSLMAVAGYRLIESATRLVRQGTAPGPRAPGDFRNRLVAACTLVLFALPGLIPVIGLLFEPVSAGVQATATYIQVYFRLAHHLDPMRFPASAYAGYITLILLTCSLAAVSRPTDDQLRFYGLTALAVIFAVAGVLIGWGPRPPIQMPWYGPKAQLLKFYPFRLADVLVPIAAAVAVVHGLNAVARGGGRYMVWIKPCGQVILFAALFAVGLWRAHAAVDPDRYSGKAWDDWNEACQWINQNLPADALVHTPHKEWSFKWSAQRAEYVSFKDCPQDAAGIVEWNRRLNFVKHWFDSHYDDRFYSADELRDLRRQTQITHIFTDHLGPLELVPIHRNDTFQVYDLTALDR